ncbi:MAG: FTR1 family protein, partial [Gemmatimonadota bacterium]
AGPAELARRHADLERLLARTAAVFAERPSGAGLFAESFLLLLREGFEAILIIGAIVAVLVKSGAASRRREVWLGVALAVAASLVTAAVFVRLVQVAPAHREVLEGAVMLVAAVVLFYVSFWLVSKIDAATWQGFVRERIRGAVEGGGTLALAAAAFLAVYREGFETVLFYQALFGTAGPEGAAPVTAGLLAGAAALVLLYVAIERFGLRVPLRPFFAGTGGLLYLMAHDDAGERQVVR